MKKAFITGLVVLLPIVLTIILTLFFINLLTIPFKGVIMYLLTHYQLFDQPIPHETLIIISKILILFLLVLFIGFFGMLTHLFFVRFFIHWGNKVIHKIPIVSRIYQALQDVIQTVFEPKSASFSQVVLVPFPKPSTWSIGLVTSENKDENADKEHMGMLSVFLPSPPNPAMGFVLLFKRDQVHFVDMKVDDAIRFVVSCGIMCDGFIKKR